MALCGNFCRLYNTLDKVYSNHNIKTIFSKTKSFLTKETHQSVHHSRNQYNLHHHHCPLLCSQNYIFIFQATCVSKTFLFVIFVLFVCPPPIIERIQRDYTVQYVTYIMLLIFIEVLNFSGVSWFVCYISHQMIFSPLIISFVLEMHCKYQRYL